MALPRLLRPLLVALAASVLAALAVARWYLDRPLPLPSSP
jgi:hypothetical protein